MIAQLLALLPDPTPVNILLGVNTAMTTAMGVIYRDCRRDRAQLWREVLALKQRVGSKD